MKIKNLLKKVKKLNLPKNQFAIFGSGPLAIRKIRNAKDIDLIVVEDLWQKYKNELGWKYKITKNGVEYIKSDDNIEIWHDWRPWYQDITKFLESVEIIDGLPFVKLEYVIEWKKKFGRQKDLEDINLIKKYLKK